MINYEAFHEEVVKIAQENEERKKKPFITKETLKRVAIALPVAAAGAGLGHGIGQLVKRHALSDRAVSAMKGLAEKHPLAASVARKLPAIAGGAAAGAGALQVLKNKKVREYLEGKQDEVERPQ